MRTIIFFLCLLMASGCGKNDAAIPSSPAEIPLNEIQFAIPTPETWQLENGLNVVYMYNPELPQVRGKIFFPGGEYTDPSSLSGLAQATGSQMREGGVSGFSPAALDKHLDDLAASIESSFGSEYGSVSFFSLKEDFEHVFDLFAKITREPAFDEERLTLWQKLAADGIKQRRDDPHTIAQMTYLELLFGKDSPYSRQPSLESVNQITRDKVVKFHRAFVRPDDAYLVVSGAVSREELDQIVRKSFGDWKKGDAAKPQWSPLTVKPRPGIYVSERDFDQSTVIMGHLGPNRDTPDLYTLNVYNEVFGSGNFGSVLFREIRTKLGLAYVVQGVVSPGRPAGNFQIYLQTKNAEVATAIMRASDLTGLSVAEEYPAQLVTDAKTGEERGFVFKFANPGYIVERYAIIRLLGFPADYDQKFLPAVKAVTPKLVQEAAGRWIKPEEMAVVVVGRVSPAELARTFKGKRAVYSFTFDTHPVISDKPIAVQ